MKFKDTPMPTGGLVRIFADGVAFRLGVNPGWHYERSADGRWLRVQHDGEPVAVGKQHAQRLESTLLSLGFDPVPMRVKDAAPGKRRPVVRPFQPNGS